MWEERKQGHHFKFYIPDEETSNKFIQVLFKDSQPPNLAWLV